jgi:LysR family carnitine catabolism transcriptional activator
MRDLNLQHLKYFLDAASLGSIGKSAKKNHVSQPAISQAIRKLEVDLNCQLLMHQKNRFFPTAQGKVVAARADEILKACANLKFQVSKNSPLSGSVLIGTSDSIAHWIFPSAIRSLQDECPDLVTEFLIGTVKDIRKSIQEGECELGVVVDDGRSQSLDRLLVAAGNFKCIGPDNLKDGATPLRLLLTEERPGLKDFKSILQKSYFKSITPMRVESWELIVEFVRQGIGIGFVPDFVARKAAGCKEMTKLSENLKHVRYELVILKSKTAPTSAKAKKVIEHFQALAI